MSKLSLPERSLAAEVRFVEEGHHVRFDGARRVFLVKSDTRPGTTYEVTVVGSLGRAIGTCTCPAGRHAPAGRAVPCKHVAGSLRRLEREGLVRWAEGRWVVR